MEPVPDDTRAPDFLRKDFLYRVKYSDVRYILQAQLRDAPNPPVVNHELFDPSQPWNEYWYPWVDMFEIRLTETVEDQEAVSRMEMNPEPQPAMHQDSARDQPRPLRLAGACAGDHLSRRACGACLGAAAAE